MNLPNKLSILRIILVPVLMFFYLASFIPYGKILAILVFIAAAITDLYDGKIARKTGQVTDLGKLLDPVADKLLYTCSLLLIVADGTIAAPFGIIFFTIIFLRDSIVNGLRQIAAAKGVVIAAGMSGKIKSVIIFVAIPLFMFISQGIFSNTGSAVCDIINQILIVVAYTVMVAGVLVTLWSGVDYMLRNKNVFMEQKDKE